MQYTIRIEALPDEIQATDKTNAIIMFKHYVEKHPEKMITLTYSGSIREHTPPSQS